MAFGKKRCPKCGHEWYPRVESPLSCPRCNRYFKLCICRHDRDYHNKRKLGRIIIYRACQIEGCDCEKYVAVNEIFGLEEMEKE